MDVGEAVQHVRLPPPVAEFLEQREALPTMVESPGKVTQLRVGPSDGVVHVCFHHPLPRRAVKLEGGPRVPQLLLMVVEQVAQGVVDLRLPTDVAKLVDQIERAPEMPR